MLPVAESMRALTLTLTGRGTGAWMLRSLMLRRALASQTNTKDGNDTDDPEVSKSDPNKSDGFRPSASKRSADANSPRPPFATQYVKTVQSSTRERRDTWKELENSTKLTPSDAVGAEVLSDQGSGSEVLNRLAPKLSDKPGAVLSAFSRFTAPKSAPKFKDFAPDIKSVQPRGSDTAEPSAPELGEMVADWLTEGLHPSIDTDYHIVHIKCGRNNTIASLSDALGNVKFTVSGGHCGFRKAGRGNQDVAYQVVTELVKRSAEGRKSKPKKKDVEPHMIKTDVRSIHLKLNGFGPGRTQAFRAIRASGWDVKRITDVTPIRRGGCRPPKKRRL